MAYNAKPADLDGYALLMSKADMRVKAQLADDLVAYLCDMDNSIEGQDLGLLVDQLMPWLTGSHFKIAQKSLEAFTELIGRLGQDFNMYTPTVLPHVVDRLGDSRDTVREKAQLLLAKLLESHVLQPQTLLDKLTPCFKHKNAKIREEFLYTIVETLNLYGTQSLSLKAYIQPIVQLLGDPTSTVRDAAIQTLVVVYRHVGDKLRIDLRKKDIHPSKMLVLEQKFDEVRNDGLMMPSALKASAQLDEPDTPQQQQQHVSNVMQQPRSTRLVKRTPSVVSGSRKPQTLDVAGTSTTSLASGISSGDAGAVTWEVFEASFELVPTLTIFNPKDMEDTLKAVNTIIGNKAMDWEKRVDALKKIRSLILLDPAVFGAYFKELSIAFLDILKELRSQVIREACITIAYMCKTFRSRLDSFCVYILQELINLVPNSVKIIASAGTVALKYVIRYTHAPKLIPIITSNQLQSKSKDIRSSLCEIVGLLLEDWTTKAMEKFALNLRDSVLRGLSDADSDARRYSRRNYGQFKRHFPDLADQLYMSLDPSTQKALDRELDGGGAGGGGQAHGHANGTSSMSASLRGSNSSLNSMPGGVIKRRLSSGLRSPAAALPTASVSTENLTLGSRLHRMPSLPRSYSRSRSGIPVAAASQQQQQQQQQHHHQQQQHQQQQHRGHESPGAAASTAVLGAVPPRAGFRSISAVDTAAAQRAKARLQYSQYARQKVSSGTASLPRAKKLPTAAASPMAQPSPDPRTTTRRTAGVSQSQPASRSTSPSSRAYNAYNAYSAYRQTGTIPKKKSGIPRSLAGSRETSPTRPHPSGTLRRTPGGGSAAATGGGFSTSSPRRGIDRPPINPTGRPVMAQKILLQSREAESALADALSPDDFDISADMSRMGLIRKAREESDESEASSVCSERSFDSSFRRNDSGSWNGSRNKLDSFRAPIEDIGSIILFCASTHWAERKDGLTSLTHYLAEGNKLTELQLQQILELFRKMFIDTHTKVYSLFLDTVNELILTHSDWLHDWLFILLTRLFNKLGTDLLASMYNKIWKTLQLVHEYFPSELKLHQVFRILCDSAQTPSNKIKIAQLRFLEDLAKTYCTASEFQVQPQAEAAVLRVVQSAVDQKSKDLRQQAQMCLIALYNCNTPRMTIILTNLPKNYQDNARTIINQHLLRSNSGTNSPSSPLSCASPKLLLSPHQGPFSLQSFSSQRSRQSSVEHNTGPGHTNTDGVGGGRSAQLSGRPMNTEEVYRNLRKTTAEIQNYSFESKLDRDTNSKDSGISQMGGSGGSNTTAATAASAGNGHVGRGIDHMVESFSAMSASTCTLVPNGGAANGGAPNGHATGASFEHGHHQQLQHQQQLNSLHYGMGLGDCDLSPSTATTTESNTPENTVRMDSMNGTPHHRLHTGSGGGVGGGRGSGAGGGRTTPDFKILEDGTMVFENEVTETDVMRSAIVLTADSAPETVTRVLLQLSTYIRHSKQCTLAIKNFKAIMKILLTFLQSTNVEVIVAALKVLKRVMQSAEMKEYWVKFLELILIKVIDCYKNGKEVSREIDTIIHHVAEHLPLDATINILKPIISTGAFPTNLCALKILKELTEWQGQQISEKQLDSIMEQITKRTDDTESMVRKAAVFCIVTLYVVLGEERVRPKFSMLNSSKVRLLNVYIGKAEGKSCS